MVPRIGVAFSGGGVRGLAHLGVLQVLQEAEIPIDAVAGTSMGGLVAGLYAAGVPVQRMVEFSERTGVIDFASPDRRRRGLFGHKKMAKLLADLLDTEDIAFEELRIPAAVVAVDVETGELVILDQGPLIPALLATSAFPLVFSPVHHQGRWLVDGGVLNNLPVDVVRWMGADRVLGVNLPSSVKLSLEKREDRTGRSSRAPSSFTHRTGDWKQPLLVAEASVGIAIQVISRTRLALCPPDLLLEVLLPNVGIFFTDKSAEIVRAGHRVATRHLKQLVELKTKPMPPSWQRFLTGTARRLRRAWATFQQPEYPLYPR